MFCYKTTGLNLTFLFLGWYMGFISILYLIDTCSIIRHWAIRSAIWQFKEKDMKNRHPSMHLHIFSQFCRFLEIMYFCYLIDFLKLTRRLHLSNNKELLLLLQYIILLIDFYLWLSHWGSYQVFLMQQLCYHNHERKTFSREYFLMLPC
jgi:hypothetical protein